MSYEDMHTISQAEQVTDTSCSGPHESEAQALTVPAVSAAELAVPAPPMPAEFEPQTCAVIAGLITRAAEGATALAVMRSAAGQAGAR